jgi:hypothetical protein
VALASNPDSQKSPSPPQPAPTSGTSSELSVG